MPGRVGVDAQGFLGIVGAVAQEPGAEADWKQEEAEHGRETGRIEMSPDGRFTEITERVPTG